MSALLEPIPQPYSIVGYEFAHCFAEFFSKEHCIKRHIAQHSFVILQHTFKVRLGSFSQCSVRSIVVNALLWYVHVTVSQFVVSHYALYNGGIPFQVTFFEISSKPNVNLSEFQDFAT